MLYRMIGFLILLIVAGHFFQLEEPVRTFAERIADVPLFDEESDEPLYTLAIRLGYLIAIIAALKLFLWKPSKEDE